jgi:hypothetical protein
MLSAAHRFRQPAFDGDFHTARVPQNGVLASISGLSYVLNHVGKDASEGRRGTASRD